RGEALGRGGEREVVEGLGLPRLAADDLDPALAREREERGTGRGLADVDVARDHRHRDRLAAALEEDDLGLEAPGGEVAALDGDVGRRRVRDLDEAQADVLGHGGRVAEEARDEDGRADPNQRRGNYSLAPRSGERVASPAQPAKTGEGPACDERED